MPILVSDFDGTLTRQDYFWLILQRHDPPGAQEYWDRFKAGELTHFQALGGIFASLRTDEAGAEELVHALDPAPGLADAVRRLQTEGWELIIASSGCGWYIERFLTWQGLAVTVHASPGSFSPETGIQMRLSTDSPFCHPGTGVDKPAIVKDALQRDPVVVVAGDSGTDRAGLLLVPPFRRFVTSRLAREFKAESIPFRHFDLWPEIVAALLDGESD
jgi:2-hydroxy-3-keto-5-methylthiopentenyl-1-phosphate phosphatase